MAQPSKQKREVEIFLKRLVYEAWKKSAGEGSKQMRSESLLLRLPGQRGQIQLTGETTVVFICDSFKNARVRFKAGRLSGAASSISIKLHLAGRRSTRFIPSQPPPSPPPSPSPQVHHSKAHSTLTWTGCQGLIAYYAPGSVWDNVDSALIVFEDIFLIAAFAPSLWLPSKSRLRNEGHAAWLTKGLHALTLDGRLDQ